MLKEATPYQATTYQPDGLVAHEEMTKKINGLAHIRSYRCQYYQGKGG